VGYKLGLNYLKAAKPVEAVTTACMVLSMYPAYPRVRKDVLEKARLAIRA
jgi:tetratricopeptide repeat protein 21B